MNELEQYTCKSCGNPFKGYYCNLCGEKIIEPKDRKLRSFLGKVIIATSITDNKFLKSVWLTISRPGFLSREYVDGRRVPYMRPLQMFFILNLIYFLFPVLQLFNSSYYTQTHILPHYKIAQAVVKEKIKKEQITEQGLALMYNDKTKSLAKLLVVVFVLWASLPLSLIFHRKNRFFTDHVALAVELTSFNLAINAVLLSAVLFVVSKMLQFSEVSGGNYLNDLTLTGVFILTNVYFLYRAARAFYFQKGKRLIFKTAAGVFGLFLALEAYRFMLFQITIWLL